MLLLTLDEEEFEDPLPAKQTQIPDVQVDMGTKVMKRVWTMAQTAALKKFKGYVDEVLKVLENRSNVLYPVCHYTDAAGLKGILEKEEFWLTDYRFLNDPSE